MTFGSSIAAEEDLEERIRNVVRAALGPGATEAVIEAPVRHHLDGPERTAGDDDEPPPELLKAERQALWRKHYQQCNESSTTRPSS